MRPVLVADLLGAAAALAALPQGDQDKEARALVARADAADRYRKRFGRAHPQWGSGTILSAIATGPRVETSKRARLRALQHVTQALLDHCHH